MSQTSKPFSRLMKASFNPLFVDEIFSITVPIKVCCSPEIDAFRNMSHNISGAPGSPEAAPKAQSSFEGICSPISKITVGYEPDSPGPLLSSAPESRMVGGPPSGNASLVPWSKGTLRDDTSESSALLGEEVGGGVSVSIISGRRLPEEEDRPEKLCADL